MEYIFRKLEYEKLLREVEISDGEHLEVVRKNLDAYIERANSLKQMISSDKYLTAKDKEYFLNKINCCLGKVKQEKNKNDLWNYILTFLAGLGIGKIITHNTSDQYGFVENVLKGFQEEIERMGKDAR
ncbi:MAG: hypothetical protein ACTSV6_07425 [Candidatus Heimdallarchaeota archaeon]